MPTKILTSQPQQVTYRRFLAVTDTFLPIEEAPYFSRPFVRPGEVPDPDDATRALLPGEVFFKTPLILTNLVTDDNTAALGLPIKPVTVDVKFVTEGGQDQVLAGGLPISPGESVLYPIQGQYIFKRDLLNPTAPAERLMVSCSDAGYVSAVVSVTERLSLEHDA